MVRQFKTGGVYTCNHMDEPIFASFLIKVVGVDWCRWTRTDDLQYRIFGNDTQVIELIGGTPSCVRTAEIEADELDNDAEMVIKYFPVPHDIHIFISSSRVILKTEVLLFCATKLIVLAHRTKERMYAPGGIGFIAAEESFDRAAKSIYENFEQADRAAKSQRIE